MLTVRKTGRRSEIDALVTLHNNLANRVLGFPTIANGTTAGKIKTTTATAFAIDGKVYTKAATDDLWDLTALTTLTGAQFQVVLLYLDASGVATIGAGTVSASAAAALIALPAFVTTKCIVGMYVAGASTVFTNALGAQGTYHNGVVTGTKSTNGASLSPELISSVPV